MQMKSCRECKPGLKGLGFWEAIAGSFLQSQAGSGGGNAAPGTVVSTTTDVTVSPQISPQFIQQQSPTNSPISAGITGTLPGFDYGSGFWPTGLPSIPTSFQQAGITPLVLVGVAGLGLLMFAASRKGKRKGRK